MSLSTAFVKTDFFHLQGWKKDPLTNLKPLFLKSLTVAHNTPGRNDHWRRILGGVIDRVEAVNDISPAFLETHFDVFSYIDHHGSYTGYYEPHLQVSDTPSEAYPYPIYEKPEDLFYMPNLGTFSKRLAGERLAGIFEDDLLIPYYTREEISRGKLKNKAKILAWAASNIDLYFAHIQGSALLIYPNGQKKRMGYSATNGRDYSSIGKKLVAEGVISAVEISLPSIKSYLSNLPSENAQDILNVNESYIFFEFRDGNAPIGSSGVELMAHRSLAVDPNFIPLGLPVWLTATHNKGARISHLMFAHDTGAAIKGANRGDYYWGSGTIAEDCAGGMNTTGTCAMLAPKGLYT